MILVIECGKQLAIKTFYCITDKMALISNLRVNLDFSSSSFIDNHVTSFLFFR